jgi:hypothetical protein
MIEPDTKDWTWVITRQCPECGFDTSVVSHTDVAGRIRADAGEWRRRLSAADVGVRPRPEVWSALEYGCHVVDAYRIFLGRLTLMLGQDAPAFANWDQDATAEASNYPAADLAEVIANLAAHGETLAAAFDRVTGEQWSRTGLRSDGTTFTVETLGRYLVHDPYHHVWDVAQGYAALRA